MLAASTASMGTSRMDTSATASARMPPTPTTTVMPNCGSRLRPAISSRLPLSMGATRSEPRPSSAVALASRSWAACRTACGVGEVEGDQSPLGLVGDLLAVELQDDGVAQLVGRVHGFARHRARPARVRTARRTGRAAPWRLPPRACEWSCSRLPRSRPVTVVSRVRAAAIRPGHRPARHGPTLRAMFGGLTGIIEGFYGPPWTWEQRLDVMAWCHERGMTHYVYAPKDDPLHRERWRDRYDAEALAGFARLVAADTLRVGFALSPGLSIDYESEADRAALLAKVDQVIDLGIDLIVLALDDIPPAPGLGDRPRRADGLARRTARRPGPGGARPDRLHEHPAGPLPDGAGGHLPARGPHRVDGPDGRVRRDHRRAGRGPGGRARWTSAPPLGQLPGQRQRHGRPPLPRPAAGTGPRVWPTSPPAGWPTPWCNRRRRSCRWVRWPPTCAATTRSRPWEIDADLLGIRTFAEACDGGHPASLVDAVVGASDPTALASALADLRAWRQGGAGPRRPRCSTARATSGWPRPRSRPGPASRRSGCWRHCGVSVREGGTGSRPQGGDRGLDGPRASSGRTPAGRPGRRSVPATASGR